jgi:hypothetical protein
VIRDPSVCDRVHYVPDEGGACLAGLVTAVQPTTVALAVFLPAGPTMRLGGVGYSRDPLPGHWHWPHR